MIQMAAECEEFSVVADTAIDSGREEPQLQFVIHDTPDAGVCNKCEITVTETCTVVKMDDMS